MSDEKTPLPLKTRRKRSPNKPRIAILLTEELAAYLEVYRSTQGPLGRAASYNQLVEAILVAAAEEAMTKVDKAEK